MNVINHLSATPILLLTSGALAEQPSFPPLDIDTPANVATTSAPNTSQVNSQVKKVKPSIPLPPLSSMQTLQANQANKLFSRGYLGMGINKLPPPIRAQMPEGVGNTQGLIVTQFTDDSPAADDGIKLYDVLIAYDNKKIDDPEILIKMIRQDKPGRKVNLKVVRQGVTLTVPVIMGEQQVTQKTIDLQNKPLAKPAKTPTAGIPALSRGTLGALPRYYPYGTAPGSGYGNYPFRSYPPGWGHIRPPYSSQQPLPQQQPMTAPAGYTGQQPYPHQASPYQGAYPAANTRASYYPANTGKPQVTLPPPRPLAYQNPNIRASIPAYPMQKKYIPEKHAWGDKRHIWSDFYTDFTGDMWDSMINAPFDVGRMPGGWRAPSLSTPDPVTIGDAVTNQLPPMLEEMGNMTDFSN